MIQNKYLLTVLLLTSCTLTTPEAPSDLYKNSSQSIHEKSIQYPFLKTYFENFIVLDQEPVFQPGTVVTDALLARAKIYSVAEKRHILQALSLIKFAINTPEFKEILLKTKMHAARNATGDLGSIAVGDVLDMNRVWEVIKNGQVNINIRKETLSLNAAAVGVVRPQHLHVTDLRYQKIRTYFLAFPNRNTVTDTRVSSLSLTIFHEILHNIGYTHPPAAANLIDPVNAMRHVLQQLVLNPEWQAKYAVQLGKFTPFYEEIHKDWLIADTPSTPKTISTQYNDSYNKSASTTFGPQDQMLEICTIQDDGSHAIKHIAKSRLI